MTLAEIVARKPNVDLAGVDATTETVTRQNMLEEGRDCAFRRIRPLIPG
jgi:hypothetical protein